MSADHLNSLLRGCRFGVHHADPRFPTGQVLFLGVSSSGVGKVGVAAIKCAPQHSAQLGAQFTAIRCESLTPSAPLRRSDNTANKRTFVLAPHELRPITPSDDSSDASDASDDALTKLQLDALAQLQQLRPGDARARPRVRLLRRRSSPILPEPVRV
jgi:hypothetical protein